MRIRDGLVPAMVAALLGAVTFTCCGGQVDESPDASSSPPPSDGGCLYEDRWVPEGPFRGRCIGTSTCCEACGCGKMRGPQLEWFCLALLMRDGYPCSSAFDCTYGDAGYNRGDTFPRADGCGTCQCGSTTSIRDVHCDDTPCEDAGAEGDAASD